MINDRDLKERGRRGTYVETLKVLVCFHDELFRAFFAVGEVAVWRVCLGQSEERDRGSSEGEELANVLLYGMVRLD